jgi:hypothetical protein
MFVSTKLGTVVQLFSGRKLSTAERCPTAKAAIRRIPCSRVTALPFDQSGQLVSQERGDRKTALRRENTSFAQSLLVEGESDVASRGHCKYV